jgi:aspartate/methionine/tyrosine aminotransferase
VEAIAERITPRTRVLILNLPHNPTGGVATARDLAALADLAQRHDLWVISDEVYGQIRYDGRRDSIAALPGMSDRTVIVDGFSKGYSMTGWRLGYGVMPTSLADAMTTLVINNVSCTATFVQYAGVAALTGPQDAVTRMVAGLRAKRDLLVRGLNAIDGISCASPAGAFYCFPDISGVLERTGGGVTSKSFAERLLTEQYTAVLAGTAFGPGGEGHLRLCYATEPAELERALAAIRRLVGALVPVPAA